MTEGPAGCDICRGSAFDADFGRALIWEDALWRLTTSVRAPIVGFSYLEPRRHIPDVTRLDGPEAVDFGRVLGRVTALLRDVTGADLVYALIFGDHHRHLHVNLVPHHPGEPPGGSRIVESDAPPVDPTRHEALVERLRRSVATGGLDRGLA